MNFIGTGASNAPTDGIIESIDLLFLLKIPGIDEYTVFR
jgi:hypothetical protein